VTTSDDEKAVIACADLVGRTGATNLEIGYLHDNVPPEQAGWYAQAQYKGTRITAEDHTGPARAAEALARRLLTGARCAHCKGLVSLTSTGAIAFGLARLIDGTPWTAEQASKTAQCLWVRRGERWIRGCEGKDTA
jgi:hypothetical protein